MNARRLIVLCSALLCASVALAAGKPLMGFGVSVETDGFFSTTLKKVTITDVKPGLPADKAGLKVGDELVAADDIPVVGASGLKLRALIDNAKPGDHLKLRVHRASGEQVVDVVVGER
jgi:C-terminal processing protease CtpA/Prc